MRSFGRMGVVACILCGILSSCTENVSVSENVSEIPLIFPRYAGGVTIPYNIAPMNFCVENEGEGYSVVFSNGNTQIDVRSKNGKIKIPADKWRGLLKGAVGDSVNVSVRVKSEGTWTAYKSFGMYVSEDAIDPYLAYRLIAPSNIWKQMGIYQRNLEGFEESPVFENKLTKENCINCHSFCMQDPDKMLFHMRVFHDGTYIIDGEKVEKLNTRTPQTISPLVYPSWHPSGKYIAFSVNLTPIGVHLNHNNQVEVYDIKSDVVVYDVEKHEVVTTEKIFSKNAFETFPTFSPDGRTLYFCSADSVKMPEEFENAKYSLCSISFDPETRAFGTEVDTLYNARTENKSVSFPRVSPDGKFLMCTISGYGNFSIWHEDADLYLCDMEQKNIRPMTEINSSFPDSYHSWSSNSRWVVFSSKRQDGIYTRPYLAHVDENGKASKCFVMPQEDPDFYKGFMQAYNIPEFVKGEIPDRMRQIKSEAKNDKGIDIGFENFR